MSEQTLTPEPQDPEGTSSVIAAEQAEHAAQPPADLPSAQEVEDARAADEALEEAAADESDEATEAPAEADAEVDTDGDVLPEDADLTIATNAVDVAAEVLRRQDLRLLMIGGEVDRHLGGCVDAAAVEMREDARHARARYLAGRGGGGDGGGMP